ncbi:transcription termination/antitermination protein NusG [Tuwongella immobilis]|nr:transcription termination/antitermination NusG family protein [Tuwongella immobilis]
MEPTPGIDSQPPAPTSAADHSEATDYSASEYLGGDPAEFAASHANDVSAVPGDSSIPVDDTGEALEGAASKQSNKRWYVIKVQSGREESIKAAIERRVRIEGLEEFFSQIVIPTEKMTVLKKVTERKANGEKVVKEKRVIKETKKFPGYLMAEVEFNDRILYLFRETSGVGDFVGATITRAPIPMTDREVQAMLADQSGTSEAEIKVAPVTLKFGPGDKVKVRDGTFSGMEGEVKRIIEPTDPKESPRVAVEITIWGRPVSMDLEHWQVEPV